VKRGWDWDRLLLSAREVGLSRDEFWRLTIREVFQEFVIAKRKARSEFNQAITQAWYGAKFVGAGPKLKTLSTYLLTGQTREQDPQSMLSSLKVIAGGFGGTVRPVTH